MGDYRDRRKNRIDSSPVSAPVREPSSGGKLDQQATAPGLWILVCRSDQVESDLICQNLGPDAGLPFAALAAALIDR